MKRKHLFFFATGLLIVQALLLLMPQTLPAQDKDLVGKTVVWNISNSQVVDYGETYENNDGTLTLDYIVEAIATSDNAPITDGLFRVTVTVYSPKKANARQKENVWYLKAKWEIMDKNATKENLKWKHNESLLKGFLTAELPFNPAMDSGTVYALADLPLTLVGKYWGKATGGFYGNELFEGNMNLTIDRWQKVK